MSLPVTSVALFLLFVTSLTLCQPETESADEGNIIDRVLYELFLNNVLISTLKTINRNIINAFVEYEFYRVLVSLGDKAQRERAKGGRRTTRRPIAFNESLINELTTPINRNKSTTDKFIKPINFNITGTLAEFVSNLTRLNLTSEENLTQFNLTSEENLNRFNLTSEENLNRFNSTSEEDLTQFNSTSEENLTQFNLTSEENLPILF